jgi:hypothetical protein
MSTCVDTFNFIPAGQRDVYETAFNAITQLELWHYMKNFSGESFMFSQDPQVMQIYRKIDQLGYHGHSAGSFGCIMRAMEFIAKNSLTEFEAEYTSQNRPT